MVAYYYYTTALFVGGAVAFFSGIFVYVRNKTSPINRIWFLTSMASAIWSFGYFSMITATDQLTAWWSNWVLHAAAAFIPTLFLHFVLNLTRQHKKQSLRSLLYVAYAASLFFFIINPTRWFVSDVVPKYIFNFVCDAGPFYIYFAAHYVIWAIASTVILFHYYRNTTGIVARQIRYVLLAEIGFIGGGSVFFLTFNINIPPYLIILYSLYPIVISYAVVRYRLMDIRTIVSKIYIYFLIAIFAYSFFYSVILFNEIFFGGIYTPKALLSSPVMALLFSIFFIPLFNRVQQSSNVIFFKGYNPREIIKDLALRLSSVINMEELLKTLSVEFERVLATDEIGVFAYRQEGGQWTCSSLLKNNQKNLPVGGAICKNILSNKSIIVRDELHRHDSQALINELDKIGAKVLAPLVIRDKIIGLVVLGEKIEQDAYTKEDIDFLEIISSQAATAIENARLYQEVDEFNKTLQQKVDEQTKEIRDKAEHLKKLMEMRSEFLDITSHQLRTPVTVIKGVLSMLEEGSVPPKKQKEFLRGAFEKSIKLGEIINDILRASEMDSERFELNLAPVDLNEILSKIREDKVRTLQTKKVKLVFRLPKQPLPPILSNDKYIEQAIVNLINNSFQYTTKGSITVTASVLPQAVVIRVADTGIGIPREDLPKLFQKFARAENAVQTYTDGSGLGLFIIKQIVDATPGAKIEIEKTKVGQGTTFALTLPRLKKS